MTDAWFEQSIYIYICVWVVMRDREWFTVVLRNTLGSWSRFYFGALHVLFHTLLASIAGLKGFCKRRQLGPHTYDVLHSKTTSYSTCSWDQSAYRRFFVCFYIFEPPIYLSHYAFQTCHRSLCPHRLVCAIESTCDEFACERVLVCLCVELLL